jgi:hypothetical protein
MCFVKVLKEVFGRIMKKLSKRSECSNVDKNIKKVF